MRTAIAMPFLTALFFCAFAVLSQPAVCNAHQVKLMADSSSTNLAQQQNVNKQNVSKSDYALTPAATPFEPLLLLLLGSTLLSISACIKLALLWKPKRKPELIKTELMMTNK